MGRDERWSKGSPEPGGKHVSPGTVRSAHPRQWRGRQAPRLASGAVGATDCRRGAPVDRRLLSERQLHAHKKEIWSANVAYVTRHAAEFGTTTGRVAIDMVRVRQRKRDMVDGQIAAHLRNYKDSGAELIMGFGRFVAPKTLEVRLNDGGTRVLTADQLAARHACTVQARRDFTEATDSSRASAASSLESPWVDTIRRAAARGSHPHRHSTGGRARAQARRLPQRWRRDRPGSGRGRSSAQRGQDSSSTALVQAGRPCWAFVISDDSSPGNRCSTS